MLCPEPDANPETPLLERTAELNVMREAVRRAVSGRGAVVAVEAAAGLGKTALLDYAGEVALTSGCAVRRSSPAPLERSFSFGVVRTLFEAPVRRPHAVAAADLLRGPAGRLLLGGEAPDTATVAGDMVRLSSLLSAGRPLALVVDDAQWADGASLEVLAELAAAAGELPLAIVVAWRSDDPDALSARLAAIAAHALVLRPRPLTVLGAATLIRRHAAETSLRDVRALHEGSGGSPWLLAELTGPGSAHEGVRVRLAALTARDRAVAAALAVLGSTAAATAPAAATTSPATAPAAATTSPATAPAAATSSPAAASPAAAATAPAPTAASPGRPSRSDVVAALAGIDAAELAPARDALRAAGLLAGDRSALAHPLVSAAVLAGIAGGERRRLHREAARLLAADPAAAAGHLLQCGPHGDPEITALLLDAAAHAGGADAVRYLERALDERAPGDDRPAILARLALAAADAELPGARERLHQALGELEDAAARQPLLLRLVELQVLAGGDEALLGLLDAEAAATTPADGVAAADAISAPTHGASAPAHAISASAHAISASAHAISAPAHAISAPAHALSALALEVAALDVLAALPGRRAERVRRLAALRSDAPAVLAHRAWAAVEVGSESAEWCADVALEALAGAPGNLLAVRTLVLTDRTTEARTAIMALRASGSRDTRAAGAWLAAELALRTGAIHVAELQARDALDLAGIRLQLVAAGAREVLAGALAEQGAVAEAGAIDAPRSAWRLSLATGDYERALAQAPDEAVAAVALAHLGRREEASVLAGEAIERARRFGAAVPLLAALYARAVAEPDDDARVALCHDALAVQGCVLDLARVRLELGRTLSRQGARLQARGALRTALEEAEAVDATPLAERARRELIATGVRPSRPVQGETTLTPRQRQICSLAASGKSNREIGHALFLSIKTVETHLAAAFRKLDIGSRSDLGDALAQAC
jgi:DNA-binding CsgD family transcriptional regulator